jgi:hypothetical protein
MLRAGSSQRTIARIPFRDLLACTAMSAGSSVVRSAGPRPVVDAAQRVLAAQHRARLACAARPAGAVLLTGIAADWSCWLVGRVVGA